MGECALTDRTCLDVDECVDGTHDCDMNAKCNNEVGTFTCICKEGFFGDGRVCTPCSVCNVGFHEATECTATMDRTCAINVESGLYTIESEADGSLKCLIFAGNGLNQYPERYNWGNGDEYCGIPAIEGQDRKEALLHNHQAVWRLTQLKDDLYSIESNADGQGWECIRFGMSGHNQYPDRYSWSQHVEHTDRSDAINENCGFPSQDGASEMESLLADGAGVFMLEWLEGKKYLIKSNADKQGYSCMVFGGHGYDTNPRRYNWGNGDEYCGAGHWNGMSLKDAIQDNKQAVWILNYLGPSSLIA